MQIAKRIFDTFVYSVKLSIYGRSFTFVEYVFLLCLWIQHNMQKGQMLTVRRCHFNCFYYSPQKVCNPSRQSETVCMQEVQAKGTTCAMFEEANT